MGGKESLFYSGRWWDNVQRPSPKFQTKQKSFQGEEERGGVLGKGRKSISSVTDKTFPHQTPGHQQLASATLKTFFPSAKQVHKFSWRPGSYLLLHKETVHQVVTTFVRIKGIEQKKLLTYQLRPD